MTVEPLIRILADTALTTGVSSVPAPARRPSQLSHHGSGSGARRICRSALRRALPSAGPPHRGRCPLPHTRRHSLRRLPVRGQRHLRGKPGPCPCLGPRTPATVPCWLFVYWMRAERLALSEADGPGTSGCRPLLRPPSMARFPARFLQRTASYALWFLKSWIFARWVPERSPDWMDSLRRFFSETPEAAVGEVSFIRQFLLFQFTHACR
jgi:hypothetical protein